MRKMPFMYVKTLCRLDLHYILTKKPGQSLGVCELDFKELLIQNPKYNKACLIAGSRYDY